MAEQYEPICLNPVGVVRASVDDPMAMPAGGLESVIEIFPQYAEALKGLGENSHIWVLLWFHRADRTVLKVVPSMVNPDLPEYGVFGLRAFSRPNPVALSLVKLNKMEGNRLYVSGLDAIDGTPVVDIKPYYEQDIIFSPRTPYIPPKKLEMRRAIFLKQARNHHQEECPGLFTAVRMALIADEHLGQITRPEITVCVEGPACLADTLQGLSRARLANPPRFVYHPSKEPVQSTWQKGEQRLKIACTRLLSREQFQGGSDEELFQITLARSGGN